MSKPGDPQWVRDQLTDPDIKEALDALHELPSIYLSVGKLGMAASRCKPDSPKAKEYWRRYEELNRKGSELSSKVSMLIILRCNRRDSDT